jgi:hypothetical protein
MRWISGTLILCAMILCANERETNAEDEPLKQSDRIKQIAEKRAESINTELARVDSDHAWAGKYYCGDGLGVNIELLLAPQSGFVFEWQGCLGLYDRNYGTVTTRTEHVHLNCELPNDTDKGLEGTYIDFTPVRWGDRHYLIPNEKLISFCNAVNSREEPRKQSFGSFLLRQGDEKKLAPGAPQLPSAYRQFLLEHPILAEVNKIDSATYSNGKGGTHWRTTTAELNIGSTNGVFKGMEFFLVWPDEVQSTQVEALSANSCTVVFTQDADSDPIPQVGWKLSTLPDWRRNE